LLGISKARSSFSEEKEAKRLYGLSRFLSGGIEAPQEPENQL
jgi:hypothetical protein